MVPQQLLARVHSVKPRGSALEAMALTGAYMSISEARWSSLLVNHWAENTGVNYLVIRGYSASADIAMITSAVHLRTIRPNTRVWIEYVRSAENIADIPSRPDDPGTIVSIEALGTRRVDFSFLRFSRGTIVIVYTWGEW